MEENLELPPRRVVKTQALLPVPEESSDNDSTIAAQHKGPGSISSVEPDWDDQFEHPQLQSSRLLSGRSDKTFHGSQGSERFTVFVDFSTETSDVGVLSDLESEVDGREVFDTLPDLLDEVETEDEADPSPF